MEKRNLVVIKFENPKLDHLKGSKLPVSSEIKITENNYNFIELDTVLNTLHLSTF